MELVDFFKALGDDIRLKLVFELVDGPRNVGDLGEAVGANQPLVSHHLNLLRMLGVVERQRQGKQVYYTLLGKSSGKGISFKVGGAKVVIARK